MYSIANYFRRAALDLARRVVDRAASGRDLRAALAELGFTGLMPAAGEYPTAAIGPGPLTPELLFGTGPDPAPRPPRAARLVAYGARPACLVHGTEAQLAAVAGWAFRRGLTALLTPTETVPAAGTGGFSNLPASVRPACPGSGGLRELVVGTGPREATLAWAARTFGWDAVLGTALGYPPCCVRRFAATWDRMAEEYGGDPVGQLVETGRARPADWRVNPLGRYQGARVIEHFPCRWGCRASRLLAGRYLDALGWNEPTNARELRRVLRAPYLYAYGAGVVGFPGAAARRAADGWAVSYRPGDVRFTDPAGELAAAVRGSETLVARSTDVFIGGRSFPARTIVFQ